MKLVQSSHTPQVPLLGNVSHQDGVFHAVSEPVLLHDDQGDLTTEQCACILCCFLVSFFCSRTLSHPVPQAALGWSVPRDSLVSDDPDGFEVNWSGVLYGIPQLEFVCFFLTITPGSRRMTRS